MKTCRNDGGLGGGHGRRTGRIAVAGPIPNASDQREFALMERDKIEAGAESTRAMAEFVMTMNQQLGAQAFRRC